MPSKSEQCRFMLQAIGVQFARVIPATGFYRTSRYSDCYRWEFTGQYNGVVICGGCWFTMTECVKARQLELNVKTGECYPVGAPTVPLHPHFTSEDGGHG